MTRRSDPELDAPLTPEEERALAEAEPHAGAALALRAAHAPAALDDAVHEAILARALGVEASVLAPSAAGEEDVLRAAEHAGDAERRAAEDLRRAFAGEASSDEAWALVGLARVLLHTGAPRGLDDIRHQQILRRALPRRAMGGAVVGALALAAAAAGLWISRPSPTPPAAALVPSRSTAELFEATEAFPRTGGESDRIDRIAASRSADLRQNRFAAWGVK